MGRNRREASEERETVNELKESNRTLKKENRKLREEIIELKKLLGQEIPAETKQSKKPAKFVVKKTCEKCGSEDLKELAISPTVGKMILCGNCKHRKVLKNEKKEES
jgi:regulator of replication initiation timing